MNKKDIFEVIVSVICLIAAIRCYMAGNYEAMYWMIASAIIMGLTGFAPLIFGKLLP
jgi:Ca2+/Na+ antiporter